MPKWEGLGSCWVAPDFSMERLRILLLECVSVKVGNRDQGDAKNILSSFPKHLQHFTKQVVRRVGAMTQQMDRGAAQQQGTHLGGRWGEGEVGPQFMEWAELADPLYVVDRLCISGLTLTLMN